MRAFKNLLRQNVSYTALGARMLWHEYNGDNGAKTLAAEINGV